MNPHDKAIIWVSGFLFPGVWFFGFLFMVVIFGQNKTILMRQKWNPKKYSYLQGVDPFCRKLDFRFPLCHNTYKYLEY